MLRPPDRSALYQAIELDGKICSEIGVFDGGNARQLLCCRPSVLYLIDTWKHEPSQPPSWANPSDAKFEEVYLSVKQEFLKYGNVRIVREDSCKAAERFANYWFDFVYIDTLHERDQCLRELNTWSKKIKPGGWLCGHDYTSKYRGIIEAVTEFCAQRAVSLSALTIEEGFPSFGIQLP